MARQAKTRARPKTQTFRYTASVDGRLVKGSVRAPNEIAAQQAVAERGQTPVSIEMALPALSLEAILPSLFAIKQREVINFSRQLAALLESGITLLPAVQLLAHQGAGSRPFRRVLGVIAQDLSTGKSLSSAIARHTIFSDIYHRTLAVGERTGRLETVLKDLAEHMEKQDAFAKKVAGALTYPAIVLVVALVVGGVLLTVALPPMVEMFTSLQADLPLPTLILIGLSDFVNEYKWHLVVVAAAGGATALWLVKQPRGRRLLDQARLTLPLIGPPYHMAELARFCRTMSMTLSAGLSLQEIMDFMPHTTTNRVMAASLHSVRRGLLLGQGLSQPMSHQPVFPPLLVQMVAVGEESNTLEATLRTIGDFYENTADEKTAAMVSMVAPLSTIFIAAVAGFIAIAVIMPMYGAVGAF